MTKQKRRLIKILRWLFTFAIAFTIFYLNENQEIESIEPGEPPVLYANQCQDNLHTLFLDAIHSAEQSILLIVYSLTDEQLIEALNSQAKRGISIKVVHDAKTPNFGIQTLASTIKTEPSIRSGLMHQKILIVDKQKVWLGSANFTPDSLRLHENLVIGLINHEFASAIEEGKGFYRFKMQDQEMEYWSFPKKGKKGLERLIQLIDEAERSLYIGMFTWTHPLLTDAVIRAHKRGVSVKIILDKDQTYAVNYPSYKKLQQNKIEVRLGSGLGLVHHKFAWIDEKILVNGSANWTKSAFSRNSDCFLIISPLNSSQNEKLEELWQKTWSKSKKYNTSLVTLSDQEHLLIFGQRPMVICHNFFESIDMAA